VVKLEYMSTYINALQADAAGSSRSVLLDRRKAVSDSRNVVFLQLYRQLRDVPPRRLRQEDQAWMVRFHHEGAEDAGGPYRESLALLSADLESGQLPLLLPTPNARDDVGDNRDKFVPNPECRSAEELRIFRFIGTVRALAACGDGMSVWARAHPTSCTNDARRSHA